LNQHEQQVKNAFLEALQGKLICETLDVTSKELLRFKEEKKISKFVETAENTEESEKPKKLVEDRPKSL